MKKILFLMGSIALFTLLFACKRTGNTPEPTPAKTDVLQALPKLPSGVVLNCTQAVLEKAEGQAGSQLLKKDSFAGYTKLDYKTSDEQCPRRIYLIKESEDRLSIVGFYTLPNEYVWKEENVLHDEVIQLFKKEGYEYDRRIDPDNKFHHYFLKPIGTEQAPEFIECVVKLETLDDVAYSTFSMRITDVVAI